MAAAAAAAAEQFPIPDPDPGFLLSLSLKSQRVESSETVSPLALCRLPACGHCTPAQAYSRSYLTFPSSVRAEELLLVDP